MHSSYASSQVQVFVQLVCTKDKANVIQASKVSKIKISASSCTPVFFTVGRRVSIYVETLLHCGTVGFRSSQSQNKPANYQVSPQRNRGVSILPGSKQTSRLSKSFHGGTVGFRSSQSQDKRATQPKSLHSGTVGFRSFKSQDKRATQSKSLHRGTVGFRSSQSQDKPADYTSLSTEGPWVSFLPESRQTSHTIQVSPQWDRGISFFQKSRQTSQLSKSLHRGTVGFRSFKSQDKPANYPSLSTVGPWGFVLPKVKTNQPTSQVSPQRDRGVSFLQKSRQTSQLSTSIKEAIRYASRSPLPPSCLVKFKNKGLNLEQHLQKKQFWL